MFKRLYPLQLNNKSCEFFFLNVFFFVFCLYFCFLFFKKSDIVKPISILSKQFDEFNLRRTTFHIIKLIHFDMSISLLFLLFHFHQSIIFIKESAQKLFCFKVVPANGEVFRSNTDRRLLFELGKFVIGTHGTKFHIFLFCCSHRIHGNR